jgi:hypothetical protein
MKPLLLYFREDFLELWSIDPNDRLTPLVINSSHKIPLYFFLSGDQILMDDFAKENFSKSIPNSFGDFWKNTGSHSLTYKRFNAVQTFDQLLPFGIKETILPAVLKSAFPEHVVSQFLNEKNTFVLYDSFVDEKQREIINKGLFEIVGFDPQAITILDYWDIFRNTQVQVNSLSSQDSFLLVNASLGNIYIHLIGINPPFHISKKVIEGKGHDPRVSSILDFIAEFAIAKGSFMKHDDIKQVLVNEGPIVLNLLKNGLVRHSIKNSHLDISPLKLDFFRTDVEGRLNNKESINYIRYEFDNFRRSNNAERIKIFLSGDVINQEAFKDFFTSTYSMVNPLDAGHESMIVASALKQARSLINSSAPKGGVDYHPLFQAPSAPVLKTPPLVNIHSVPPPPVMTKVPPKVAVPPIKPSVPVPSPVQRQAAPPIVPPKAVPKISTPVPPPKTVAPPVIPPKAVMPPAPAKVPPPPPPKRK